MAENMASSAEEQLPSTEETNTGLAVIEGSSTGETEPQKKMAKIELNAEFSSFIQLRDALDKYQTENHVQLIVKDSKLLNAESTKRIIPKVYHLVNKSLMYHSITYCCKCHGELKQKPGTRIRNVGAKRLNCPMYLKFKLTSDLQCLTLFDLHEVHNHGIDPNTFQLPPRQQVYCLSRMKRQLEDSQSNLEAKEVEMKMVDVHSLVTAAIKDVNSVSSLQEVEYEPVSKLTRLQKEEENADANDSTRNQTISDLGQRDSHEEEEDDDSESEPSGSPLYHDNPHSPLDPESSCSDSDEEEFRTQRHLLPFPIRLIGAAIQSSPELMAASKQLIEIQKSNLLLEKRKLFLQTKQLDLENAKLSLEVKLMEKNLAAEMQAEDTTIYLQAQ